MGAKATAKTLPAGSATSENYGEALSLGFAKRCLDIRGGLTVRVEEGFPG